MSAANSTLKKLDLGLALHGFAEVGYAQDSGGIDPQHLAGFNGGAVEFYLSPNYGRVRSLFEPRFEYDHVTGSVGVDLERAQVGYELMDSTVLWFGRFHTPLGYWNTAFHHGAWLQTSVERPRFINFEDSGGVLPAHTVGAWLAGKTPLTGAGRFSYDLFVGNGDRIIPLDCCETQLDFNGFTDNDASKLIGARLAWHFAGALDGLEAGIHGYRDRVEAYPVGAAVNSNRITVGGAYAAYDTDDWQVISEWYRFSNDATVIDPTLSPGTSGTHRSNLWFIQAAKIAGDFVPYVRYENATISEDDPYFGSLTFGRPYRRAALGLKYNIDPHVAVKFEASRSHEEIEPVTSIGGTFPGGTADAGISPAEGSTNYSRVEAQFALRF
jgi:hypothetical protein